MGACHGGERAACLSCLLLAGPVLPALGRACPACSWRGLPRLFLAGPVLPVLGGACLACSWRGLPRLFLAGSAPDVVPEAVRPAFFWRDSHWMIPPGGQGVRTRSPLGVSGPALEKEARVGDLTSRGCKERSPGRAYARLTKLPHRLPPPYNESWKASTIHFEPPIAFLLHRSRNQRRWLFGVSQTTLALDREFEKSEACCRCLAFRFCCRRPPDRAGIPGSRTQERASSGLRVCNPSAEKHSALHQARLQSILEPRSSKGFRGILYGLNQVSWVHTRSTGGATELLS